MIVGMAAQARDDRIGRERDRHLAQTRGYRFVAGRGAKPSATETPAPLRYWQYDLPGRTAVLFVVVVVGIWLGLFGWVDGWAGFRDEAPLALGCGLVVLGLSISRYTVSDHGLSMDVAGSRTSPSNVIPLMLIRNVRLGEAPADWPEAARQGGRWPGRQRVAVRYLAEDGRTEKAFTHWVRDPKEFAAALGHRL
jgi:hypothetical protein